MKRVRYTTNQKNPQVQAYKDAIKRGLKNQHVIPQPDGWAVKRAGAEKPSGLFNTQGEAIQKAITIAKNQGTAVFIHGRDGRIQDSRNY